MGSVASKIQHQLGESTLNTIFFEQKTVVPLTHSHSFIFVTQVKSKGDVRLVRLSSYILDVVAKRDLGREIDPERPPVVLMKMDIEGSELEVVPDLLVTGAMQHVNVTMIEWHWNITAKDRVQALVSMYHLAISYACQLSCIV